MLSAAFSPCVAMSRLGDKIVPLAAGVVVGASISSSVRSLDQRSQLTKGVGADGSGLG